MPVVFAQPEPFDADISRRYAESRIRAAGGGGGGPGGALNPALVQAAIASQRNALAGVQGDAEIANRVREFDAIRQDRANQFNGAALDAAQARNQAVQNAAWLSRQELTQAEEMRLQRQKQQVAEVMADPNLLPEEKNDMVTSLRTGIDILAQRKQRSMAKQEEEQAQMLGKQREMMSAFNNTDEAARTKAFEQRVIRLPNPMTGEVEPFYLTSKGDLEPIQFSGGKGKAQVDEFAKAKEQYDKTLEREVNQVRRENAYAADVKDSKIARATNEEIIAQARRNLTTRGIQEPMPPQPRQTAQPAPSANLQSGQQPAPPPLSPQDAAKVPTETPTGESLLKPFKPGDTQNMHPRQVAQVQRLHSALQDVQVRNDLDPVVKADVVGSIHAFHQLLADHGDLDLTRPDLPDSVKAEAKRLAAVIAKAKRPVQIQAPLPLPAGVNDVIRNYPSPAPEPYSI